MSVRIVTDSTCDLPPAVITALGISVIPVYIHVNGQDYRDGIDLTREAFYQKLPAFAEQPTTGVPSMLRFSTLYNALAAEGASEVLSIHISASLSGVLQVAEAAARETTCLPVTVFDSRQLSLGTGFLVETAARMAKSGCSVPEIVHALNDQVKRTHTCAALDTLEFLRRSGRMNGLVSSIGELVQLKPLLKMYDGKATSEKIRTRSKALKRLGALLHLYAPFEKLAWLHSNAADQVTTLMEEVRELLPPGEIEVVLVTPALGAHLGPGAVGFSCVSQK
jgi:DegV family protein with EDD domain